MNNPRVLLLTGEYPPIPGGISDYTYLLRSALNDQHVTTVVMSSTGAESEVNVQSWSWKILPAIREVIHRHAIDVVHIQYQAGAFGMHPAINLLPRLLRDVPVITTFHDLRPPYLFPKAGRLRFLVMRRMARWSSSVIVTNPVDHRTLGAVRIPATTIPLGPSLPAPDVSLDPDSAVGYFGFPSRQKGFDQLVAAIGEIPLNSRPALCVVGGRSPGSGAHGFMNADEVDRIAEKHAVCVRWTGFLDARSASNALAACSCIAFPFPGGATQRSSALIAALQTGRPVLTTSPARSGDLGKLAQLPQLIEVSREDPVSLRRAIERTTAPPEAWQPLPDDYRWDSIARRHTELYASLLRDVSP